MPAKFSVIQYEQETDRDMIEADLPQYKGKAIAALNQYRAALQSGQHVPYSEIKDKDGQLAYLHFMGVNGKQVAVVVWYDEPGRDEF